MTAEAPAAMEGEASPTGDKSEESHHWHHSERGELTMACLDPLGPQDWGGMEIALPKASKLRLIFQRDGTVLINGLRGRWQLSGDGSLELAIHEDTRVVKERIWFSKPNLRLRCTLEEFLDGRAGRSSFSSEIRRVARPQVTALTSPD